MNKNKITITLLIGIIALTTISIASTITWYSLNSRNSISAVDIVVDSDRELFLSTTDKLDEAKEELTYDDLHHINSFAPVTSAHKETWMNEKKETPSFYDDTVYFPSDIVPTLKEVSTGFYSQELYLFSDDDVYVTIDPASTYIIANEAYNKEYAKEVYQNIQTSRNPNDEALKELSEEEIYKRLNELVKAMRFSLLILSEDEAYDYVIIDPYKKSETYLGGLLDNDIDQYYDYYRNTEDEALYERVYGDINDRNLIVYDDALENDSEYLDENEFPSAFNARHKKGVKTFNYEASKENGLEIKKEDSHSLDEFTNRINNPINIPVYKEKANKIVLSIYIEGYDLDSINFTMGATFLAGIDFIISREM